MSHKTIPAQRPFYVQGIRFLALLSLYIAGFCLGLILLSFADDLVQYQRQFSEITNLIIGLSFGVILGIFCVLIGRRIWPARP